MIDRRIALALAPMILATLFSASASGAADQAVAPAQDSASAAAPSPLPASTIQAHHAGQVYDYSLHGEVGQSISGRDAAGRAVDQHAMPTTLTGRERIAIKQTSARGLTLHRSGAITATVAGRPVSKPGTGWTLVNGEGTVVRDEGTLGGLFLLPLGFLGERAVNGGEPIAVGNTWSGRLGTKLYGMIARPKLTFKVTGTRFVLGTNVFTIVATGAVQMKEPVVTNSGAMLGYAAGKAFLTLHFDYDRTNARVVSMDLRVTDDLVLSGSATAAHGTVNDSQRYLVALDAGSISASAISRAF